MITMKRIGTPRALRPQCRLRQEPRPDHEQRPLDPIQSSIQPRDPSSRRRCQRHPGGDDLSERGTGDGLPDLVEEAGEWVDLAGGTPVRWVRGDGWKAGNR